MKNTHLLLLFLFLSTTPLLVSGQDKNLDFFAGKWDFKIWMNGNQSETPDLTAVWTLEKGLDSAQCFIGYVQLAGGVFTREIIAWNPVEKMYIRTITANNGAFIELKTKGWADGKIVWIGNQYLNNIKTGMKEEIVKTGPNEFKAVFFNLNKKKWEKTQTEILTRMQ